MNCKLMSNYRVYVTLKQERLTFDVRSSSSEQCRIDFNNAFKEFSVLAIHISRIYQ